MKRVLPYLLFLFSLAATEKSFATHAAGMDISYACYGNNLYQFYATFYRDCIGIVAPPSLPLYLSSNNCAYEDSFVMTLVYSTQGSDSISHLAGLCPDEHSQCTGGTNTGYEQYIYAVNITLPFVCDDWVAGTRVAFRNNAITNLQSPGQKYLYVECHLSNANGLCDNSPLFTNVPLAYSCVHEPFLYNHGAYDPDGDSLVYTLVNPLNGHDDPINYVNLFLSPAYPLYTEDGTFGFDSLTGQMSCIPSSIQIVVISVLIDEYRNGVKIGSTQRDVQVVIKVCNNDVPEIPDGIQNLFGGALIDSNTVQVCPGSTIDFDLIGVDADVGDTITMTTNLPITIPDATFTFSGVNPDSMHIHWQTSISDTGFYVFTVTIKDDACPISGSQIYAYTIQIGTPMVDAGPDQRICITNPEIQLSVIGLSPFSWSNPQYLDNASSQFPVATLPGLGTYEFIVTADLGGYCQRNDTVLVTVDPDFTSSANVSPDEVCAGTPVNLQATASGGIGNYSYQWTSLPSGFSSFESSPTDSPVISTTYISMVVSGGCVHHDSVDVLVHPLPDATFSIDSSLCINEIAEVDYAGGNTNGLQFNWNFGSAQIQSGSGAGPYEVKWDQSGVYSVVLNVTDANGCVASSSKLVDVHSNPVVDFHANTQGCVPYAVFFQNLSTGAAIYHWDFGDGNTSTQTNPEYTYSSPGVYTVTLTATSSFGCSSTLTKNNYIIVLAQPLACAIVQEDITHPFDLSQSTFHFNNCSENASSYLWDFGDGFSSTQENPQHTYTATDTFYVMLTASNGFCSDTLKIGPIIIIVAEELHFPNAISPNDDGHNDYFHELGGIGITDLYYAVYDRWGELIFETHDLQSKGWDGTHKGEECELGVYVWKAEATFVNGAHRVQSGNLTLVR